MEHRGFTPLENRDVNLENGRHFSHSGKEERIPHNSLTGFTLLELVVVVAIIGLLSATVLIPNLLRFRDRGAASRATSDMRIIMSAIELSALEGCATDIFIKSGQRFECAGETYIERVPSAPAGHITYWGKKGDILKNLEGEGGGLLINPQVRDFQFYSKGFKNDTDAKFMCEAGSCWCESSFGVAGCQQ